MSERFSAVCSPGLAPFAAAELGRLGVGAKDLEFEGSARELYRASLRLRTADRLLLKLGEFPAAAFPPLAHGACACRGRKCSRRNARSLSASPA